MVQTPYRNEPPLPTHILHVTELRYVRDGGRVTRTCWFLDHDGQKDCDISTWEEPDNAREV